MVIVRPAAGPAFRLGAQDRNIPVGSEIDARRGEVDLRAARPPTSANRVLQDGQFSGGLFTVLQRVSQQGLTELDLVTAQNRSVVCGTGGPATAAAGRLSTRVLALLRSTAHGHIRTRGRYGAATVRGTNWEMVDRCDGTLFRVERGVVLVSDFRLHKTIALGAGQSYLARAA